MTEKQMHQNKTQPEEDQTTEFLNPQPSQSYLTRFEVSIINGCKEIGMTDDEIEKWMMEI